MLAKLNIFPKLILDPTELTRIQNTLNSTINIISGEHICEILKLTAFYNTTNITFDIQAPIIPDETFIFSHIIPTPLNKTLKVLTNEYALTSVNKLFLLDRKCKLIAEVFYCETSDNNELT